MIALILEDRCTGCNNCVTACPTHVLDASDHVPIIARLDQCQTCYLCELYCEQDAIYVGPDQDAAENVDRDAIIASGHLGQFRRAHGWEGEDLLKADLDEYWRLGPLLHEGAEIAARRYASDHIKKDISQQA